MTSEWRKMSRTRRTARGPRLPWSLRRFALPVLWLLSIVLTTLLVAWWSAKQPPPPPD